MRALAVIEWPALLAICLWQSTMMCMLVPEFVCVQLFVCGRSPMMVPLWILGTSRQVEARAFDISHFGNKPRAG